MDATSESVCREANQHLGQESNVIIASIKPVWLAFDFEPSEGDHTQNYSDLGPKLNADKTGHRWDKLPNSCCWKGPRCGFENFKTISNPSQFVALFCTY
jgi:hypothetical protein